MRPLTRRHQALLLLPAALYLFVAVTWQVDGRSPVTGDEPHYLIAADALLRDHHLSVNAAYARDFRDKRIFGPIDWEQHTRAGAHGAYSIHGIGLPALVAIPFRLWGIVGARVLLAILMGAIPFLFFAIARFRGVEPWPGLALAISACVGLPYLPAAGQIFPDLPTGVLLLGVVCLAVAADTRGLSNAGLLVAGVLLALLPWLHVKNALPAAAGAILVVLLERRRRQSGTRTTVGRVVVPLTCSLLLLGAYQWWAFGDPRGPYQLSEAAGGTSGQALMVFLGLHLDQSQGIFVMQPLFLLGVVGLVMFGRRAGLLAAGLGAMYLAVVVPNSFHSCWYGCHSLPGRFLWSVAAFWFLPLVYLYSELGRRGRTLLTVAALAATAWQLALLTRWYPGGPSGMYLVFQPDVLDRDSPWSTAWRFLLPSFYGFDSYLRYSPNWVAGALFLWCAAVGAAVAWRSPRRPLVRGVIASAVVVSAVCLTVTVGVRASRASRAVDLAALLPGARVKPASADSGDAIVVGPAQVAGETRRSIAACPPSRIIWDLTVPRGLRLHAYVGVDGGTSGVRGGVLFRVRILADNGYDELVTLPVDPLKDAESRRWIPISCDLSKYEGRLVQLVFNTYPVDPAARTTGSASMRAYWADPVLHVQ